MLADCVEKFGLAPKTLAADAGYGKADFLTWLENRGIIPYIPLRLHYPSGNKIYGLDHFTYQSESNSFECPEGKQLKYRGIKLAANRSHIYRSTEAQCRGCLEKAECTSGRYKQLVIHVDEEVRQRARERNQEPDYFRHQRSRKKIEALFGELKNRICLRRTRFRRLKHVREQFFMAATAQNLKRLVRFLASVPPTRDKLTIKTSSRLFGCENLAVSGSHLLHRRSLFQQLLLDGHQLGVGRDGFCEKLCNVPGQEFGDASDGMFCDASEDMAEVEFRVESVELGCSDEGVEGSGTFSSSVQSGEEIVFLPNATTRNARSAALLSISTSPSSR